MHSTVSTTPTTRRFRIFALCSSALLFVVTANFAHAAGESKANKINLMQLDADGDGKLSRSEVATRKLLNKNFDNIDTNKDGFISADEIKSAMTKKSQRKFAAIDTNSDRQISKAEADAKSPMLAKNFEKLDTNKDGFVSPLELDVARKATRTP